MGDDSQSQNGDAAAPSDPVAPKVGEVVADRYKINRLLGVGGFARVYEARDLKAGGRVALKVLDAEKSCDTQFARRFEQEIRIVRELRHPNTIKIWDLGTTEGGLLYAVMEYAEGKSLDRVMSKSGPLPPERAGHIAEQILKGLAEAHARGIVHRDLKPENILLCEVAGEPDFVKILDFGIAKSLVEDLSMVKTQTGTIMGTPGYAAPEVLMGFSATPAADVYAAGLILVEMLTGKPLVQGDSVAEVLLAQMNLRPDSVAADFSVKAFNDVIRRALASEPEERYQNTGEMLVALRESKEHLAVTSGEQPAVSAAAPLVDDEEAIGAPTEAVEEPEPVEGEAPEEEPLAQPARRWPALLGLLLLLVLVSVIAGILRQEPRAPEPVPSPEVVQETPPPPEPASPAEVATVTEPELVPLPSLPGPSAESLSWDWLADLGGRDIDPVAVLSEDHEIETPTSSPEPEPLPRRLMGESARLNHEALEMLQQALRAGRIETERVAESRARLADLYDTQMNRLLDAHMCVAALMRLERARENRDLLGDEAIERLGELEPRIAECGEAAAAPGAEWDAARFLALIRDGGQRYEAARALSAEGAQQRGALLRFALGDFETARDMLVTALATEELPPARRAEMEGNRSWLDARIVAILCGLDKCAAAELHLDQALGAEAEPAEPEGELLALQPEITACKARTVVTGLGFDWPLFLQLVQLGAELYDRAVTLLEPEPPLHRVRLRITSQPPGARIRWNGESLGETPYDGTLETVEERVVLTLSRRGYERSRVRVDTTREEIERHVELERENPFGRVRRIGDRE